MGSPHLQEWKTLMSSSIQLAGEELFHSMIACHDLAAANPKHPPTGSWNGTAGGSAWRRSFRWPPARPVRLPQFACGGATKRVASGAVGPAGRAHATCAGRALPPSPPNPRRKLVAGRSRATDRAAIRGRASGAGGTAGSGSRRPQGIGVPGCRLGLVLALIHLQNGTEQGRALAHATREPWGNWCGIHALHWLRPLLTLYQVDPLPQTIHDYMDRLPEISLHK
jgi:hypothetical protein